ncbi:MULTISPECIES: hypothetical protein [Flavobacterium]|uniref:Lipoprotein n=1 Tax=Flavobacterium hankyongi TaxID=1176532 RepID=A0ABP9AAJ5_9FLAO|nr:hypothetical protein [Flavobacterium sp. N1846]
MKVTSFIKIIIVTLLSVSCQNPKETPPKENGKNQTIEQNDSVASTTEEEHTNKAKGLNYVKVFMFPENDYTPTQQSGIIVKYQNGACTGCLFTYNPKHNLKEICEFKDCELEGNIIQFSYKQVTLNYFKTGDYNYFEGYGEIYEQFMTFKKQDVTKNNDLKKWDEIEGFTECYKEEQIPNEILNAMPELSKYLNLEILENNVASKNLPSYADIRGTLIQETNISTIKEMLGEPDDIFDYNQLEWDVYYFVAQKNGKVGHLAIRINGLSPRIIDEVTFYNPGDRIRLFNSYYISPIKPK